MAPSILLLRKVDFVCALGLSAHLIFSGTFKPVRGSEIYLEHLLTDMQRKLPVQWRKLPDGRNYFDQPHVGPRKRVLYRPEPNSTVRILNAV